MTSCSAARKCGRLVAGALAATLWVAPGRAQQPNEEPVRRPLGSRRAVIAEVLAALQRVGRRPPPALMVSPEDALQSVRTAILLGAVLPDMKVEVDTLIADLAELVKVRSEIATEREALGRDLAALSQERMRMT